MSGIIAPHRFSGAPTEHPYVAAVLADSPFAYFRDDEESGSTSTDEINGHVITHDPGVLVGEDGLVGKAISCKENEVSRTFSPDHLDMANINASGEIGIEAIVKINTTDTSGSGVRLFVVGDAFDTLRVVYDGTKFIAVSYDGASASVNGPSVTLGEWYHIFAKNVAATARLELFVNGSSQGTSPGTFTVAYNSSVPAGSNFQENDLSEQAGDFYIHHRTVYAHELSGARILAHAEAADLA